MHIDYQVIVFCFSIVLALMACVIYDLYEKLVECENALKELQTTVGDGKLVASILGSAPVEKPAPTSAPTKKRRRRNRSDNRARRKGLRRAVV